MERPYVEFSVVHVNTVGNFSLAITEIKKEPYSIVSQVVQNIPLPTHLTVLPESDDSGEDEQVYYYFLIAAVLIVIVILTFLKTSAHPHAAHLYSSIPNRHQEILVLEESEREMDIP